MNEDLSPEEQALFDVARRLVHDPKGVAAGVSGLGRALAAIAQELTEAFYESDEEEVARNYMMILSAFSTGLAIGRRLPLPPE